MTTSWISAEGIRLPGKRLLAEGAWAAFGQIGAALGALLAVRLLTEVLEPEVYGLVTLLLGIAALCQGLAVTPLMQAVLRFYPDAIEQGTAGALRSVSGTDAKKIAVAFGVTASLAGVTYGAATDQSAWLGALIAGIFAVDSLRAFKFTLLNATRRQRPMALWSAADAWIRPLVAIGAIAALGPDAGAVLVGYLIGGVVLAVLFSRMVEPDGVHQAGRQDGALDAGALRQRMWLYAAPLVPIALAGWVSGVGDRYLIGGVLGLHQAGIYAAAYALVSRPFLMMNGMLELTARPIYYQALAEQDSAGASAALRGWLMSTIAAGGVGFVLIWLLKDTIAWLLLAEPYRVAADLLPWIAGGSWLLVISQVYTRICYAHHDTKAVLWIETAGALLAVVVMIPAILWFGIAGAAMAVPVYFGAQLGIAVMLARRAERQRS